MKGGFLNKSLNNFAQSKVVLYVVLALALFNLLGYLVKNNLAAIILFLLVGFSTTYLTKNMIYVLLASIMVTNFLVGMGVFGKLGIKEGMGNDDDDDADDEDEEEEDDEEGEEAVKEGADNKKKGKKGSKKASDTKSKQNPKPSEDAPPPGSTKSKNRKNKSGFANLDDEDMSVVGTKVDYATTVENAYDSLEKILGGDGIEKMTGQASKLAQKQDGLLKAMKKMEPMMNMANKMIDKLNGNPLSKLTGISQDDDEEE